MTRHPVNHGILQRYVVVVALAGAWGSMERPGSAGTTCVRLSLVFSS